MSLTKNIKVEEGSVQGDLELLPFPSIPWIMQNGNSTPDEVLKALSQSWDASTWERYLQWYETQLGESQVPPRKYDKICEEQVESIFVNAQSSADDDLKSQVNEFILKLTAQQRRVVELIFWEGRSERFVADFLNINHKSVHRLKIRALNKIRGLLKGGPISPIMKGKKYFPSKTTGVKHGVFKLVKKHVPKAS